MRHFAGDAREAFAERRWLRMKQMKGELLT